MNDEMIILPQLGQDEPLQRDNDKEIIEKLLDRLSNDGLQELINEIKDEQELRKLSTKRMEKLKSSLKIEKNKIIRDINIIKEKMIKGIKENDHLEDSEEEESEIKPKPKKRVTIKPKKK